MKLYLGLFTLLLSQTLTAGNTLLLRGRVPGSYNVVMNEYHRPVIKTNQPDKHLLPKVTKIEGDKHIRVTVIQP